MLEERRLSKGFIWCDYVALIIVVFENTVEFNKKEERK